MSIKLYCGIPGSGKSYEVVVEVILSALAQGRRVISNIAGLNYDVMVAILIEDGIPKNLIGVLVCVTHDQVKDPLFWRTDKDDETGRKPFISKGDVVCLDENWRFYNGFSVRDDDGNKLPQECKNFFRMHRQFPDPATGFTCEIALISQDPADFSRFVRGVVEQIFYMEKLTAIGSTSRYRVDIYQRKMGRKPMRQLQRSYNSRYFPCYKSHSQAEDGAAAPLEESADKRGNILHGALFRVGLPLAAFVMLISVYGVYKFFNPASAENIPETNLPPVAGVPLPAAPGIPARPAQVIADQWRLLGWYRSPQGLIAVISNDSGMIRKVSNPPAYKLSDSGLEFELPEGGFVTPWTGQTQKKGGLL
jgi:zona occludens toxin